MLALTAAAAAAAAVALGGGVGAEMEPGADGTPWRERELQAPSIRPKVGVGFCAGHAAAACWANACAGMPAAWRCTCCRGVCSTGT